jgi:hypothetical protein
MPDLEDSDSQDDVFQTLKRFQEIGRAAREEWRGKESEQTIQISPTSSALLTSSTVVRPSPKSPKKR